MDTRRLLEVLSTAEALKRNTRHSFSSGGRKESVAEHCWRLCFMAYFVGDEFPDVDIDRVIRMCLMHDIGEAFTGDIPAFSKTESDEAVEWERIKEWIRSLPEPFRENLTDLFAEMREQRTKESQIYLALDKMEAIVQHNEADLSTWLPLEYETNLTYGEAETAFAPYMRELKETLRNDSLAKIRAAGNEGGASPTA